MSAMGCEEIQVVLDESVRGGAVDAEATRAALAHAEECGACREYLASCRSLQAALAAWAAEEANLGAPPRVEKALRAAFRQQARSGWRRPLAVWIGVAAAAAVAAVAIVPRLGMTPSAARTPAVAETVVTAPLFADPLEEGEAGEVVRVSLPASALHAMGVDVADESLGDTVEADVVLGADGVARAVDVVE
jgi:predicted anti-sigma-YlaC factor YlaD